MASKKFIYWRHVSTLATKGSRWDILMQKLWTTPDGKTTIKLKVCLIHYILTFIIRNTTWNFGFIQLHSGDWINWSSKPIVPCSQQAKLSWCYIKSDVNMQGKTSLRFSFIDSYIWVVKQLTWLDLTQKWAMDLGMD